MGNTLQYDYVTICGIPYKIIPTEDLFNIDTHFGQINYTKCEIRINKNLKGEALSETLTHEILHGILLHLGYTEQMANEQFVQAVANAINQTFKIKNIE